MPFFLSHPLGNNPSTAFKMNDDNSSVRQTVNAAGGSRIIIGNNATIQSAQSAQLPQSHMVTYMFKGHDAGHLLKYTVLLSNSHTTINYGSIFLTDYLQPEEGSYRDDKKQSK